MIALAQKQSVKQSSSDFINRDGVKCCLKRYWGYDSLRPLQGETMHSVMEGRDTLTVLPTGGGKSLCYQLPAMLMRGMAVVISPTISLMKDQVDALTDLGIAAAYWNSSLAANEVSDVIRRIRAGELKLLYVTPERLCLDQMVNLLIDVRPSFFVIDEAHCISEWGHSFRADYRRLVLIKQEFPQAGVHAFTASATDEVQRDILKQLKLKQPQLHLGHVDRPNLTYRMLPRQQLSKHVVDILSRHPKEPGIVYCSKRKDVDSLSAYLNGKGIKNLPYHAGLTNEERTRNQRQFATEKVDVMVATIAFGLGIDRSNIRFVVHANMPKNMEQYYQETGRAGRDGLPAYCYLLFGAQDYRMAMFFIENEGAQREVLKLKLDKMYNICLRPQCRHKVLAQYFDQTYESENCKACDYCLEELELVTEPVLLSQKILSAIVRCSRSGVNFGGGHIADVLRGKETEKVVKFGHETLSVFALLPNESVTSLRHIIEQLVGQGLVDREVEYSTLSITEKGKELLRGDRDVILVKPITIAKSKAARKKSIPMLDHDFSDYEKRLFETLREERSRLAADKGVPAYIIFSDKALWDMAAKKPLSSEEMLGIHGVGEEKKKAYGAIFARAICGFIADPNNNN